MTPRYRLIEHADGNAGFAALLTYTLNGVRVAETDGAIAVVHLDDRHATNWFLDPDRGDNVWEYYFEPVMGVSSRERPAQSGGRGA